MEIIKLNGSIELAPIVGLSEVIVDIVETGTTLRENGLEVLEEIRKKDPAAKVIMCSAMGQEQMITNALMLGASDFIVKPFKADEFMKVVEYTLSS